MYSLKSRTCLGVRRTMAIIRGDYKRLCCRLVCGFLKIFLSIVKIIFQDEHKSTEWYSRYLPEIMKALLKCMYLEDAVLCRVCQ